MRSAWAAGSESGYMQQLVDHGIFACALTTEAREAVDARLGEVDDVQLAEVIGQDPESRRFGHAAIAALQQSQTNDDATSIMETLVLPLARTQPLPALPPSPARG